MDKNERKNTDKTRSKPVAGNPKTGDKPVVEKANAEAVRKAKPAGVKTNSKRHKKPEVQHAPTANKETDTQALSLPVTEMEVHHHPQLEHKPKPFKEYLLEGFMIFIAVMMGFIAENVRESITDSEHVRQLTTRLAHDLKADIQQLNDINQHETAIIKNTDTLYELLRQPLAKADLKRIQLLTANSHSMWPFHPSEGAITAIKNELHLKKFSNSEIITYFSMYEKHIELIRTAQDINLQYQRTYLDPFLTQHFTPENLEAAFNKPSALSAQMRKLNQEELTQLRANIVLIRVIIKELLIDNRRLEGDAVRMLKYVTKQYDLDDNG